MFPRYIIGEPGGPVNQPRRRIVTSSVRQDDDHTITLEATQDMLFMSPEGLPSEGDIAEMTQVRVCWLKGPIDSVALVAGLEASRKPLIALPLSFAVVKRVA